MAIRAGGVTRVVEAALAPPFTGDRGLNRSIAAGLPRLAGARFRGEYPFAHIEFEDPDLPVTLRLEAFNPFIPLEADDSALPVAILRYTVRSRAAKPVEGSLAFTLFNPIGKTTGYERVAAVRRGMPDLGQNVNEPPVTVITPITAYCFLAISSPFHRCCPL